MIQSISWQQYIFSVLIATAIYYLFIWIVFFKARLSVIPGVTALRNFSMQPDDGPDEVMTTAQHVIDELRPLFHEYRNKNEMIQALQLKLRKYRDWEEPGFRSTINQFITQACESKCSIRIEEEDQRVLWS